MKPILFNTAMVRAILDGRKTQTRRLVKPQPVAFTGRNYIFADGECPKKWECCDDFVSMYKYQPGDVLYVRETWAPGCTFATEGVIFYKADDDTGDNILRWHPSIHMPKEAARIFLRVTDVRVERLQDITEADALAEGSRRGYVTSAGDNFGEIWDNTIKPADRDRYGWDANPWVWVICFKRIPKEAADE